MIHAVGGQAEQGANILGDLAELTPLSAPTAERPSSRGGSYIEVELPSKVTQAVKSINTALSFPCCWAPEGKLMEELQLNLDSRQGSNSRLHLELLERLACLYTERNERKKFQQKRDEISAPLKTLTTYFVQVAQKLTVLNISDFFLAATRHAPFQDWHGHSFYTYLIYMGRENGTEIMLPTRRRNSPIYEETGANRGNNTLRLQPAKLTKRYRTITSDPSKGLLIAPWTAHRAIPSHTPEGKAQANLIFALIAFPAE